MLNVKRAKKWQQILQFSLVQQAYKEKEEETCRKEKLKKQTIELIQENAKPEPNTTLCEIIFENYKIIKIVTID